MATEVKLPQLAEGVEKGDVISVLVKEGDSIQLDDPVIEVQSEKATLSVPSSAKGKISKILVKAGDVVKIGQTLIVVEGDEDTGSDKQAAEEERPQVVAPTDEKGAAGVAEDKAATQAPAPPPAEERVAQTEEPEKSEKTPAPQAPSSAPQPGQPAPQRRTFHDIDMIPAGPAVRRIAREVGLDLNSVRGSGRNGRILVDDLDPYIKAFVARQGGVVGYGVHAMQLPDFSKWGPVRRVKADGLRRKVAEKMSQSWATIPHVHQFAEADVTDLLSLLKRHKERVKKSGGALTFTVFVLKAIGVTLGEFPQFNATFDSQAGEVIFKDYTHIGVAVDTEAGLVVPVIRDVDKKPILQLAKELQEIAQKARDKKLSIEEMRGSTFTISNLGGIGGTHFTPIINAPDSAILGIGRSSRKPVFDQQGNVVARDIVPLVLGYDHRIIDGSDGARFVVRLTEILENFEATFLGL